MPNASRFGGSCMSVSFTILVKGRCFFWTFGYRPSFTSQSKFVTKKQINTVRG
jgi:hypothetical protein